MTTKKSGPAKPSAAGAPKPGKPPEAKAAPAKSPTKPADGLAADGRDWAKTLFLPKTDFAMRAGLPDLEPKLLARWEKLGLYKRLRKEAKGREKFILHDGPPYANGNLHIGHALNKILKDAVTKSQQMLGKDSNYVPGWDCHGLPIEWEIEKQIRAKGKSKDDVPIPSLRRQCREFAQKWIGVQMAEFKRYGVVGDWENYYTTMAFKSEALIANELLKFAMNGTLYRGSKPVMWSVVEQTALAEAEVEYQEYTSDAVWVKFPVKQAVHGPFVDAHRAKEVLDGILKASIVIWTTTPWTIPGNRAVSYSSKIAYALYDVTDAPDGSWATTGDKLIVAKNLVSEVMKSAKVDAYVHVADLSADVLDDVTLAHPLAALGYTFDVPLLDGDHVTDDTGTGFVHTAPGHGTDDYQIWMANAQALQKRGIDTTIPFTVDAKGLYTAEAPGFEGKRVLKENGDKGDANDAVIKALTDAGMLIARARHKHDYPHSWRSKKPVIFRNTPQWFIAMDKALDDSLSPQAGRGNNLTIRSLALKAIAETRFVPGTGQNRIRGMIEAKPDWVISRQRYWGVPLTIFVNTDTGDYIPRADFPKSKELTDRIVALLTEKGGDAWWEPGAKEKLLGGLVDHLDHWEQVMDTVEVWFDSGSTHAFVLEERPDLKWPASLYLEGSDQHRGWFHSSLIESCGTRGRAPYDAVLTHGFVMAEDGRKMSKSLGNGVEPGDVIKQSGAEILRAWALSADYADDLRIGPEILKSTTEAYRKLRNTLRWLLGVLGHYEPALAVTPKDMPELERLMLHRLSELDELVRQGYEAFDFKRVFHAVGSFAAADLSAFYFDVRKDALYCDPYDSKTRRAALTVCDQVFTCLVTWLAPILSFTCEEAWLSRHPSEDGSVHLQVMPDLSKSWRDDKLAEKWETVRRVRRVVTGALELERAGERIGKSVEAAPEVYIEDAALRALLKDVDLAEVAITSGVTVKAGPIPAGAFRIDDVPGVGVVPALAKGKRCARSWVISEDVGKDPAFPDLSPRDAEAVRQFDARQVKAGS